MSQLEEMKARLDGITSGPWTAQEYDHNPGDQGVPIIGGGELGSMEGHLVACAMTLSDEAQCVKDGDFIAHAPETQAKLIAALETIGEWTESRASELRDYAGTLNHDSPAEIRYSAYADQATATVRAIQNIITEALQ